MPFVEYFSGIGEHYVADAVRIADTGNWNPGWFGHPGSTIIYSLALFFKFTHHLGFQTSQAGSGLLDLFESDPTAYYAIGRIFVSLWGIMTIAVTYVIGKFAVSLLGGLLAASLMAVSPLHILISYKARTDSPVVFFMNLSLLGATMIVSRPIWQLYVLSGVAAGLAISTKYYGVVAAVALPVAHILRLVRSGFGIKRWLSFNTWKKLILGLAMIPITFALSSPFILLEWETVRQNLTSELRDTHLSADGLSPPGNAWWYLSDVLPDAIGVVAILLILIGLWAVRRKARAEIVVPISYALLFFVTISLHPLHWDRWLAPILPTLAILASLGLIYIVDWDVRQTAKPFVRPIILGLLVVLLLADPLYQSVVMSVERILPDTRLMAREWIHEHIPDGSKIATEWYSTPLDTDRYRIENRFTLTRKPIDDYCREDFDFLVASSAVYDRYQQERERYKPILEKYDALWENVSLVYKVVPIPWHVAGPTISVFELKSCGAG